MISKIRYERKFTTGQYEYEIIEVEATLDEHSENPDAELLSLRTLVAEHCTARLKQKALAARAAKPNGKPPVTYDVADSQLY